MPPDTTLPLASSPLRTSRRLELLAPARDVEQGLLALRSGADALYVGGPRFGARRAAGCDVADIARLTSEARLWGAKVYATLNTVLYDDELEAAGRLAWELYEAGVDALIVQDMAMLDVDLPPLPLHASTQAGCDSAAKVAFLASAGVSRAILARELSLREIRAIAEATDVALESFVFGALCVGESGRCYLSLAVCGRSGNRGECAQPCRSTYRLVDEDGRVIVGERHLLAIRDLDLSDHLEDLVDAGVTSFKIEGRLKDASYVKNVVGHLRRKLDALLLRRPELTSASAGRVTRGFVPDPTKTFQRGLCTYRIDGARRPMATFDAAGHLGEPVGVVRAVHGDRVTLAQTAELHPGDGLAFLDGYDVTGTIVNAADGRAIVVQDPSRLRPGVRLYRNHNHAWHKLLRSAKLDRRISVHARLEVDDERATLRLEDETGVRVDASTSGSFPEARDPDASLAAVHAALERMGGTPFVLASVEAPSGRFVPVSRVHALRRDAVVALEELRRRPREREPRRPPAAHLAPLPTETLDFTWNVANRVAEAFYRRAGATAVEGAAEVSRSLTGRVVMTTRHCLRYELGWCQVWSNQTDAPSLPEPRGRLFLENGRTRLLCKFDCDRCRMELLLLT